jgi:hypothetical protein
MFFSELKTRIYMYMYVLMESWTVGHKIKTKIVFQQNPPTTSTGVTGTAAEFSIFLIIHQKNSAVAVPVRGSSLMKSINPFQKGSPSHTNLSPRTDCWLHFDWRCVVLLACNAAPPPPSTISAPAALQPPPRRRRRSSSSSI